MKGFPSSGPRRTRVEAIPSSVVVRSTTAPQLVFPPSSESLPPTSGVRNKIGSVDLPPINTLASLGKIQSAQKWSPINPALRPVRNIHRPNELTPIEIRDKTSGTPKDPFSTPARRRRLISDMAKFLMKQYCLKACKNVHIYRIHSAAALIIQGACRMRMAIQVVKMKIFVRRQRAGSIIVKIFKMFSAKLLLRRMKEVRAASRRLECSILLQCALRRKLAYKRASFLRGLIEKALAFRRERAAQVIQSHYRAFIRCRWERVLRGVHRGRKLEEKRLHLLRNQSVFHFDEQDFKF